MAATICSGVNASYALIFCNLSITERGRGTNNLKLLCIVVNDGLFIFFGEFDIGRSLDDEAGNEGCFRLARKNTCAFKFCHDFDIEPNANHFFVRFVLARCHGVRCFVVNRGIIHGVNAGVKYKIIRK